MNVISFFFNLNLISDVPSFVDKWNYVEVFDVEALSNCPGQFFGTRGACHDGHGQTTDVMDVRIDDVEQINEHGRRAVNSRASKFTQNAVINVSLVGHRGNIFFDLTANLNDPQRLQPLQHVIIVTASHRGSLRVRFLAGPLHNLLTNLAWSSTTFL